MWVWRGGGGGGGAGSGWSWWRGGGGGGGRRARPVEGDVAVKIFRPAASDFKSIAIDALREVSALAAVPEHRNIMRLLDVDLGASEGIIRVLLVHPLFDGRVSSWTQKEPRRPRMSAERRYRVAESLINAVSHLHCSGGAVPRGPELRRGRGLLGLRVHLPRAGPRRADVAKVLG